jgi:seryl-tRNA synthetase
MYDIWFSRNLPLTTGTSTYYLLGDLAQLEQALVQYTIQHLISSGFSLVTVPDIIHPSVIVSI